ncbi:hypothetical protein PUR29_14045 [Methylobacterium ajmalii]|uniref:Uncharacterized protein n=1 Tax=Methylobacterium ajmalii TaxID=2738439 RepID=A0ABU9ZTP6_9HYPH
MTDLLHTLPPVEAVQRYVAEVDSLCMEEARRPMTSEWATLRMLVDKLGPVLALPAPVLPAELPANVIRVDFGRRAR